jgi:hypothetical protein
MIDTNRTRVDKNSPVTPIVGGVVKRQNYYHSRSTLLKRSKHGGQQANTTQYQAHKSAPASAAASKSSSPCDKKSSSLSISSLNIPNNIPQFKIIKKSNQSYNLWKSLISFLIIFVMYGASQNDPTASGNAKGIRFAFLGCRC